MAALGWTARGGGLPRAYLVTIVTWVCFNELDSAKARRKENRGDRLPEPLDLDAGGIGHVEMLDQISMAFLVVLQRLTPAERARENVAKEKRSFSASPETHERLLAAFTQAASAGDLDVLVSMLAEDAVMITDKGQRAGASEEFVCFGNRFRAPGGSPHSWRPQPAART